MPATWGRALLIALSVCLACQPAAAEPATTKPTTLAPTEPATEPATLTATVFVIDTADEIIAAMAIPSTQHS
ncbi:hypothetical protein T492DRAFT_892808 [Pavlovales sp. CCMP2436]|nr:hypothetical protein T492DRAFT_892808 [Pavlovales sp. CCMP2436]